MIKAVLNKKPDYSDRLEPTNTTEKRLRDIMEARDAVTGRFIGNSVKGAIRKGLDGDRRIGQSMNLEIGITQRRTGEPGVYQASAEAHLTIQLEYSLNVD